MRKLQRGIAPTCLNQYRAGQDNWDSISTKDKADIWIELDAMQVKCCAYCEDDISNKKHIEHFRQRHRFPQAMFAWDNLFGSCNRQDSCGKYKDHQAAPYNDKNLLKPDVEDPELLLIFDTQGGVSPRKGLSLQDTQRAIETIRVFNLNCPVLKAIRRSAVVGYIQTAECFAEMAQYFQETEWFPLLQEEIDHTKNFPFTTAIKHVLTRQS